MNNTSTSTAGALPHNVFTISTLLLLFVMIVVGCKATGVTAELHPGAQLSVHETHTPEPYGVEKTLLEKKVSFTYTLDKNEQTGEFHLKGMAKLGGWYKQKRTEWTYPDERHRVADCKVYFYSVGDNTIIEAVTIELDAKHTEELLFEKKFTLTDDLENIRLGISYKGWNSIYPTSPPSYAYFLPERAKDQQKIITELRPGTQLSVHETQTPEPYGIEKTLLEKKASFTYTLDKNEQTGVYNLKGMAKLGGWFKQKYPEWTYPDRRHKVADCKVYFYSILDNAIIEAITIELGAEHTEELLFEKKFTLTGDLEDIRFGISYKGWSSTYPTNPPSYTYFLPKPAKSK